MAEAARRRTRSRIELCWVAAATFASFVAGSALELQESLSIRLARHEHWQADELPLTLTVLACGLAWYAFRRRQETRVELSLRERAEARVAELLQHNRELAQQLIQVQENERRALARELHDEFGQGCTAIRIETACLRHCAAGDRAGVMAAADRADAAASRLYALVRDMLRRLRPANLDELGLTAALQEVCAAWQERTGVACTVAFSGDSDALGEAVDITVYRIVQEALTNVARHARASSVTVALVRAAPGALRLRIEDDGCGMAPGLATRGLGLMGATERAAAVGGELRVQSEPGRGVRLELTVPLRQPARVAPAVAPARVAVPADAPAQTAPFRAAA